jgi:molybdopterin converting factor small subunit
MQSSIIVEVSLFGAFREMGDAPVILALPGGAQIRDVRRALRDEFTRRQPDFKQHKLLDVSMFADERTLRRDHEALAADTKLVILPPVSGG